MEREHSYEMIHSFYKGEFKKNYPGAFGILELGGVHPDKDEPIDNPYIEGEKDSEDFRNIGEHCVDVGIVAQKISSSLKEVGAIDDEIYTQIVERALIHDTNKRFEILRRKAQKAGQPIEVYSRSAYETMFSVLEQKGHTGPEMEYVKTAGKETGHGSLADFLTLDKNNEPALHQDKTLSEMIVHLADDMVASPLKDLKTGELLTKNADTQFVSTAKRMDLGNFSLRYNFMYQEGIAFDEAGQAITVKNKQAADEKNLRGFNTYAYWQEKTAELICSKLKSLIEPENKLDPNDFIEKIANK